MAGQDRAPKGSPRRAFGKMLRFYREKAGLSRETLADLAHISASTIISYETGWRVPTRPTVADIDAVPELNTDGALIELWDEFEEGMTYQVSRPRSRIGRPWRRWPPRLGGSSRWLCPERFRLRAICERSSVPGSVLRARASKNGWRLDSNGKKFWLAISRLHYG